jgi:hypothetical protein
MKTKITQLKMACLAQVMAAAFIIVAMPAAMAQPPSDDVWSIPFLGLSANHEGGLGWDSDGTGPEPSHTGHQIPFPGWSTQYYYMASKDYDDIDSDISGFPQFVQALAANGYDASQVQFKYGISSLGADILGQDWFIINDWLHSLYYDSEIEFYLDGELILSGISRFNNMHIRNDNDPEWLSECSFSKPDSAWSPLSSDGVKSVGRAFLNDLGEEEIRFFMTDITPVGYFVGNGRNGAYFNIGGYLEKGRPELPYQGLTSEHQGMAGWNSDGTGPEPAADGHLTQRYYIASRDYDDIDPDPNSAFGHMIPGAKGLLNFTLQMAYRGYTEDQLLIKMGLSSLGNDIMGLDWGFAGGTDYWCNYYDLDYIFELNGENLVKGMIDTSVCWMSQDPLYWWTDANVDKPRDYSTFSGTDAQIIAQAFLKDTEGRHMVNDITTLTYDTATFAGNGRYDGGYFNVAEARFVGTSNKTCTFIQTDTLKNSLTNKTVWSLAHSPYYLDNSLVVDEGHTLEIQPGVKVAIRGPYFIDVNGNIEAIGEEDDTITFTRSNPLVKWNSLRIPGMYPDADSSLFSYCIFENSYANSAVPMGYNGGGAVKIGNFDRVRFSHCLFRNNLVNVYGAYPPSGGALALWTASPLIEYCTFFANRAGLDSLDNYIAGYGGAICCYLNSNPVIKYSLFHGNHATSDGGAIEIFESCAPVLLNNTITDNMADNNGGGVDLYLSNIDSVMFTNNIIWDNRSAWQSGQQVSLTSADNIASFKYNDIEGGLEGFGPSGYTHIYYAPSNIDFDPEFCDSDLFYYYLSATSPCGTAGQGGSYMGAFEVDFGCWPNTPEQYKSQENLSFYPNPSYSESPVSVMFSMESSGQARLEIYNLTGEKVAEPVSGYNAAGEHQVAFSTEGLPTGIYVGRLTAGNKSFTAKFIKMK